MRSYEQFLKDKAEEKTSWEHSRICNCNQCTLGISPVQNTTIIDVVPNRVPDKQINVKDQLVKRLRHIQHSISQDGQTLSWPVVTFPWETQTEGSTPFSPFSDIAPENS